MLPCYNGFMVVCALLLSKRMLKASCFSEKKSFTKCNRFVVNVNLVLSHYHGLHLYKSKKSLKKMNMLNCATFPSPFPLLGFILPLETAEKKLKSCHETKCMGRAQKEAIKCGKLCAPSKLRLEERWATESVASGPALIISHNKVFSLLLALALCSLLAGFVGCCNQGKSK